MSVAEGFFVDWDGNARSTLDPGGGYLCETDLVARYVAITTKSRDIITKGFAILDDALGDKPYLAGHFSVADPILFYVEFWADKTGIPLPDHLVAHYRRMLARPAVQQVLREEGYNPATLGWRLHAGP